MRFVIISLLVKTFRVKNFFGTTLTVGVTIELIAGLITGLTAGLTAGLIGLTTGF